MVKKRRLEPKPWSLTSSACLSQKSWVGNPRGTPCSWRQQALAQGHLRVSDLCRRSGPVCLHLVYSCVQSYLGTHSTPRAGLCTFITTQPCVDSPTYRSHLHHLTRPHGAWGLLPDLTSGGWAAMGTALSQPKACSSPPTASACLPPRDLGGRTFLVKPCGEASYKHATG